MSAVNLKVVAGTALEDVREPSPETSLRRAFSAEARAEKALLEARFNMVQARKRYAAKHRLQMMPSMDTLRRLFGIAADGTRGAGRQRPQR